MKIKILKKSRIVEFPEYITIEELKEIICKFAPIIAKSDDLTPFSKNESNSSTSGSNVDWINLINMFNKK